MLPADICCILYGQQKKIKTLQDILMHTILASSWNKSITARQGKFTIGENEIYRSEFFLMY